MTDSTQEPGSPVDTGEYYQQHIAKEREYVRVYVARPAKPGDSIVLDGGGFGIEAGIDEDGYKLCAYANINKRTEHFLNTEEFAEKTSDAGKLELSLPRGDLSAEDQANLTPVKKGKRIAIDVGLPIITAAECDGFLCKLPDGDIFLSNYAVTTAFNYAGKKAGAQDDLIVSLKDEPALKGFILEEDVTFNFKAGPYEAKKGSFLFVNPKDEDGYTAFPPGFAAFGLRRNISEEQLAAMSDVSVDHDVQVKGPLKLKKTP